MSASLLEVEGVSRRFGRTLALDDVSYRAGEAKVYGLIGANGAGKTTLIKHLLGLLRARSGSVRMFGLDPVRYPVEVLRRVGYLAEERELPEWIRVDELMRYTQAYYPSWDPVYARRLLETFHLDGDKKVKELSKGMRAQVALVAAVAHRPDLLILDEPSTGLDAAVRQDILAAIVRAVADDGRTVLFSSHLLDEVERMSDHVTMIHRGRVVLDGALDTVRGAHFRGQIRFAERLQRPPTLEGALALEGAGRSWTAVFDAAPERFRASVAQHRGEVVRSREATLEEIFVARVGREPSSAEAA